jgi:hypothetical protein
MGRYGEIGPFQIRPTTWDQVDPKHQYDINTVAGGAMVAGLYYAGMAAKLGSATPAAAVGYQAGPGNGAKYAAGDTSVDPGRVAKCFPGQNAGPQNCPPPIDVDPAKLQVAMTQGPDATLKYIASTAPNNVSLGSKWQAAESSLVYASLMRGDVDGAQKAQEMILGMSRQGASYSLMNADRALAAGDGTTAAQQLAVAHAFFPDGTYGKFGVDSQGRVWAQQFSEKDPTLALGQPFQVTRQNLQPQLVMTQDPNKYLQAIQTLNTQNAQIEFEKQHGAYFGDLIKGRLDGIKERAAEREAIATEADKTRRYGMDLRAQELAAQNAQHETDVKYTQSTGLLKEREANEAKVQAEQEKRMTALHDAHSKEAETLYGPGAADKSNPKSDPIVYNMTPEQRSIAALTYKNVRDNDRPDFSMPSPTAYEIANDISTHGGKYKVNYDTGEIVAQDGSVRAQIPKSQVSRILGARQPPAAARPNPAVPTGTTPHGNWQPPAGWPAY